MSYDPNIIKATLELLVEKWPGVFSIHEARRRPLKLGIHRDILATLSDAVSEHELRQALRVYVSNKVYHSRLIAGAARIDLAGEPVGAVTEHEATKPTVACAAKTPSEAAPAPPALLAETMASAAPRCISLADLRVAAQRRKEAAS